MAIAQTQAAVYLQSNYETVSSHKIISLLLDGALERAGQAVVACAEQQWENLEVLTQKSIAIINGLRSSLDMSAGGEIATNLADLYDYMLERIQASDPRALKEAFIEVSQLLGEIKSGWDRMDLRSL